MCFFKKKNNVIIVTGNGFDIQCGLNSRYSDFFEWCEKNIEYYKNLRLAKHNTYNQQGLIQGAFEKNDELTVWDLYFMYKSEFDGENWFDLECEINNSLQSDFWNDVLDDINYFENNNDWRGFHEDWYFSWMMKERYHKNINSFNHEFKKQIIDVVEVKYEAFYNNLYEELKKFESRFSKYMKIEIEKNKDYYKNQTLLIDSLLKKTVGKSKVKILTFNYTKYNDYNHLNIHGDLDSNTLIFGISSKNNKNDYAKKFEKSERRIIEKLPIIGKFIDKDVETIIFYGTSFNDLDFDYYQYIIDKLGANMFYFCYSNYENKDREYEQNTSVRRLIEKIYEQGRFLEMKEGVKLEFCEIAELNKRNADKNNK